MQKRPLDLVEPVSGFTLIELMIVVAILGILAALAVPNFMNYQCKAKQTEAKTYLGSIRTAEEAYFLEFETYSGDINTILFETKGFLRYTYGIESATNSTFTGVANGTINGEQDLWRIDQNGQLSNDINACS